jgi:hypothetical protein
MSKKPINELSTASRFVSTFFDGIKANTTNRFLQKAKAQGVPTEVLTQLEKIKKEKEELDIILARISKK